jgi:leucyl aminopeptidase
MEWSVEKGEPGRAEVDLLVLGVTQQEKEPDLSGWEQWARLAPRTWAGIAAGRAFDAEAESWLAVPGEETAAAWLLLVGLGPAQEVTLDRLRRAAGVAARQARALKVRTCALALPGGGLAGYDPQSVARCWVEGVEMNLTPTGELKSSTDKKASGDPQRWRLVSPVGRDLRSLRRGVAEGEAFAAGCLYARRLVNLPGSHLTPQILAEEARRLARQEGYRCRVLGRAQLEKEGMGGLLGVSRGSREEPCLIVLETRPSSRGGRQHRPSVALVGKGVTFDAGGISLKPAPNMDLMKSDMSGAAAVLGAALIAARLQLKAHLLVVVPATENLPDGAAIKPGDVLTMASGKTVEVLNTDAEGRLILADALHFACRKKPDWLLDIATLTGACASALGEHFAGLMSTSAEWIDILDQAGGETFERVWHLPLTREHHKAMESQVADLKNLGGRQAGMSTAAAFLAAFVPEEIPWAHLDIAGPAWTDSAGPLGPKGATGFGARLLARAMQILLS